MSEKIKAEEYSKWEKNIAKELSPLEALKEILAGDIRCLDLLEEVETALKDYEKAKNTIFTSKYDVQKEHKALEIIKELFDIEFITIKHFKTFYTMRLTNKTTNYVQIIDIKTKEQFDLLKEVLK